MVPQTGQTSSPSRLSIDIRRFPWIKRLAADYAFAYDRVGRFFAGNPADAAAWRGAIERAQRHPRDRARLSDLVLAQQTTRGAPPEAVAAAARLRDAKTVAIVTGQQAGLFGGPLFTLLKALTTIRLAERAAAEQGVPVVPVFWIDAEDHDWDEVRSCGVFNADLTPVTIALGTPPGAGEQPVARIRLDDSIREALATLESTLPPTEFTPALLDGLRRIYHPGAGMADAFGTWLESVLGARGLVVFDASDPAAKPLCATVFAQEIDRAGDTARLAAAAGDALVAQGYHAQVVPQAGHAALFHLDGTRVGISAAEASTYLERVRAQPVEFSPNVLLRPIVQDTLFPTVCYVAGPNELGYLGQLREVYAAFGVPMPLMHHRATATIVDTNAMRFLSKHELSLDALRAQDEHALNQLLEAQIPATVDASLDAATRAVTEQMDRVAQAVTELDATLDGAARSAAGRMLDDLKKLHGKVLQAVKRKDDTLRRQFTHAQALAFPSGHPQEREIGFVYFLNRYGPGFVDRLIEALPLEQGSHWVVSI